jgi:hypothetical protein
MPHQQVATALSLPMHHKELCAKRGCCFRGLGYVHEFL